MKKTQIGLSEGFPYCIRNNEVYCSTLCAYGVWERSPLDSKVKAFRTREFAEQYILKKNILGHTVIPYKEWEKKEKWKN